MSNEGVWSPVETSDQWMPKGHNGDKEISNNALEFSLDDEVLANCLDAYKIEMELYHKWYIYVKTTNFENGDQWMKNQKS